MDYKNTNRDKIKSTYSDTKKKVDNKLKEYENKSKYISVRMNQISEKMRNIKPYKMVQYNSTILNYRQELIDLYNEEKKKAILLYRKYNELYEDRNYYYSNIKNYSEKSHTKRKLIESDLSEHQRLINIVEVFIEHLRDCKKNCDTIDYFLRSDTFKNIINN